MCLQCHENCDPNIGCPDIQNTLLETNRNIVKRQFNIDTGVLKSEVDIIIIDYTPYTPLNSKTMLVHILFVISGRITSSVISRMKVNIER